MVGRDPIDEVVMQVNDDVGIPLPWGLLYDARAFGQELRALGKECPERYRREPTSSEDVDVRCFWGYRFAMYRTRFPRTRQRDLFGPSETFVTAVLNPTFGSAVFQDQVEALTSPGSSPTTIDLVSEAQITKPDQFRDWISDGSQSYCDLLYFFCHASTPTRVGANGRPTKVADPFRETLLGLGLENATDMSVTLQDLQEWGEKRPRRPLVFLNACGSAQADPLYGNPFVDQFIRDWQCRALVGTDWTIPTAFAAVFSRDVISRLRTGRALIDALRSVSLDSFQAGNPYPLIYGLYGEPEITLTNRGVS